MFDLCEFHSFPSQQDLVEKIIEYPSPNLYFYRFAARKEADLDKK